MDVTDRKISKIARKVTKFTRKTMRADGVGPAEFDLLHEVRKHPGITQSRICALIEADKGAVAKQTANLEAKGYLRREKDPEDGRRALIYPTEQAQSLKNSQAHIEAAFYEWLMEVLTEEEKAEFTRILDILYMRCWKESKAGFPEMSARLKAECNE